MPVVCRRLRQFLQLFFQHSSHLFSESISFIRRYVARVADEVLIN